MQVTRMALATLLLSSPRLGFASDAPGSELLRIDHVIVGMADLERGMDRFEQLTGVRPVIGGANPRTATRNALVSLGNRRYLELLAPRGDAPPSADIDLLRKLEDLTPLRWVVSTSQPEVTVRHLRQLGYGISDPLPGSRVKPDGTTLRWVRFRITGPELEVAPVLINWDSLSLHPSIDSPAGCDLTDLTLVLSSQDAYQRLLKVLAVGVGIRKGDSPRLEVTLSCPKGIVRLGAK
jgi:glyoxalase-like protein